MEKKEARNEEIKRLRYSERLTRREIADMFGISPQRVLQITGATGHIAMRPKTRVIKNHPEKTNEELAEILGMNPFAVGGHRRGIRYALNPGWEYTRGEQGELLVSRELLKQGVRHKLMPRFHSFDIQLDNGLRIDVKTSYQKSFQRGYGFYKFHIDKKRRGHYADYFICAISDGRTRGFFVIPYNETPMCHSIRIFYPAAKKTKYDKYLGRFDFLKTP